MSAKAMIPLIDIVFLSLGSLLGVMSQMELVEAIDVEISEVQPGVAERRQGSFRIVTLTAEGLMLEDQHVTEEYVARELAGTRVVLRAQRSLSTERTLQVLARLSRFCSEVSVEVRERSPEVG